MNKHTASPFRRWFAVLLAALVAFGHVGPAVAALTVLSNIPIAAKVQAKPNIVYSLDDSYSMTYGFLPDFIQGNYCRNSNGQTVGACGQNTGLWGDRVPLFAADFNKVYYNPDVSYDPPFDAYGRQDLPSAPNSLAAFRSQSKTFTADWTLVQSDPYLAPGAKVSLAANVATAVYCNSDWPLDTTINNLYTLGDGADCRMNGRKYDAVGTSAPNLAPAVGDPLVPGDTQYNYPWQKSSGGNDAKYFYRNGGNRLVHCNAADPRYPRAMPLRICSCIGGTPTGAITSDQTCNGPYTKTYGSTCVESVTNETPVGTNCHLSPASWAGPFGTNPSAENTCTCTLFNETGNRGKCSINTTVNCGCTGVGCTPVVGTPAVPHPSCPDVVTTPPTGCSAGTPVYCASTSANCGSSLWDPATNTPTGVTLLSDSNTAGIVCRHNNQAYAATSSYVGPPVVAAIGAVATSRFNYPAGTFTSTINHSSCGTVASSAAIPRHYYTVESINFCNLTNITANAQWRGFGSGTCQVKNDFATYKNVTYGKFNRVSLVASEAPFQYTDPVEKTTKFRTFDQEMENYANWFAYYRTRLLSAKTTSSIAFNQLDKDYRVGFHVFNRPLLTFADLGAFIPYQATPLVTPTQRINWYTALKNVNPVVGGQTPTLDTLLRVGDWFENGAASTGIPPHVDPLTPGVSCQNNFHIAFTDGSTYQTNLPTIVGQVDGGTVPVFPPDPDPVGQPEVTLSTLRGLQGGNWPRPYRDFGGTANSLSDIAMYYWMRDLRPALTNNVPSNDGSAGRDVYDPGFPQGSDPAWWQHVNFSAISFGAEGGLDADPKTSTAMANIFSGPTNWPAPTPPNKPLVPAANIGAYAIDDLWHATVNGRGSFVYARTPLEVSFGLGGILAGISNNRKTRVGSTFGGRALTPTNNYVYQANIERGWAGDVKRVRVDPTDASQLPFNPLLDWSAGVKLNTLLTPPVTPPVAETDNPWFANRRIVTSDGTPLSGKPFVYGAGGLTTAQAATLTPSQPTNTLKQEKIVAYLRGGSTWGVGGARVSMESLAIGDFRPRSSKLGDFSNSQPVLVGKPSSAWYDQPGFDPGYSGFVATHAGRGDRIYIGGNDGMMHSFDAATGDEVFAYVPSTIMTASKDDGGVFDKGIHALSYQEGGSPIFKHHMYVDTTVRVSDVDFNNRGTIEGVTAPNWKTIAVGGLGKGGGTYYALDITDATASTEAQAAAKMLWEFSPGDLTNAFGRPIIAKTYAYGWVVMFGSGYNNVDGKAKVHVVRARNGTPIPGSPFVAPDSMGSPTSPSGLAQINGFTKNYHNQYVEQVYGGDLNGNLWRWDFSQTAGSFGEVKLFAEFINGGNRQPITTAPQIEIDLNTGIDRYVFVGTGQLLDDSDRDPTNPLSTQVQSMYAIRDGELNNPSPFADPVITRADLTLVSTIAGTASAPKGWYINLPVGQRVVVDPLADLNVVGFVGTAAQTDVCLTSLPAFVYAQDFITGETVVTGGTGYLGSYSALDGAVGLELVGLYQPGSSFPVLSLVYTAETTGQLQPVGITPKVFGGGNRVSWRLMGQ